jgi:gluconolactonase
MRASVLVGVAVCFFGSSLAMAQGSVPGAGAGTTAKAISDICSGDCKAEKFTACGKFLEGPTFDDQENLWLVSIFSGDIHKVTPDGQCKTVANTGGEPQSLKYAAPSKIVGSDRKIGLFTVDPTTNAVTKITNNYYVKNFAGLNDLVLDAKGGAYVTDPYGSSILHPTGSVFYIPPNAAPGVRVTKVLDGLAFPNGIALSPDGNVLYVTEFSAKRVIATRVVEPGVISPELVYVVANLQGGAGPDGMTVDRAGNLYVAVYGAGQITVINNRGFVLGVIALPSEAGVGTTNVAIHKGYLYITEASKNEVWRVKIKADAAIQ